jgi:hypothetical protein
MSLHLKGAPELEQEADDTRQVWWLVEFQNLGG